mgnify:CR=1 FL=1
MARGRAPDRGALRFFMLAASLAALPVAGLTQPAPTARLAAIIVTPSPVPLPRRAVVHREPAATPPRRRHSRSPGCAS